MKTFSAKPLEVKREWYVVDATDKVVGRLAAEIALRLRGKDKPEYTPHVDTGDYIIVVNADKLVMTGAKAEDKKYFRHSGYPGGVYETTFRKMQEKHPGPVFGVAGTGEGRALFKVLRRFDIIFRKMNAAGVNQPQQHLSVNG